MEEIFCFFAMSLEILTQRLQQSQDLTTDQVSSAIEALLSEDETMEQKEKFLVALANKGETARELAGFAQAMRTRAIDPQIRAKDFGGVIVDTCGTGGDKLNLFNISTAAALVVASAGVPIAKHGNRAVTSRCGSADVIEALGLRIDLPPAEAKRSLRELSFAFFFAPNYHPAFKKLAPLRKKLAENGQRTIFNLLGPLLNPARPTAQVVGLFAEGYLERYAQALKSLGAKRAMVIYGHGMDELSTISANIIFELQSNGSIVMRELDSRSLGFSKPAEKELSGGNAKENATCLENIFNGHDCGPRRDIVCLNAAAALLVAGKANDFAEGIKLALQQIESGATRNLLEKLRRFSAGQ